MRLPVTVIRPSGKMRIGSPESTSATSAFMAMGLTVSTTACRTHRIGHMYHWLTIVEWTT